MGVGQTTGVGPRMHRRTTHMGVRQTRGVYDTHGCRTDQQGTTTNPLTPTHPHSHQGCTTHPHSHQGCTGTHPHSHPRPHSLSHTHSLSCIRSFTHSLSHTHSDFRTFTHSRSYAPLSLSHHTQMFSPPHTFSHAHTLTRPPTHTQGGGTQSRVRAGERCRQRRLQPHSIRSCRRSVDAALTPRCRQHSFESHPLEQSQGGANFFSRGAPVS